MSIPHEHAVPREFHEDWLKPWTDHARHNGKFRSWLHRRGFLTPHFTLAEAKCHDGTPIPRRFEKGARNHAFNMEKLRHVLGDKPITVTSWYRTDSFNRKIHGARKSQHVNAVATDVSKEWIRPIGRSRVQHAADIVFASGGVGTYPDGSMHFDSRGSRARWTSYVGW